MELLRQCHLPEGLRLIPMAQLLLHQRSDLLLLHSEVLLVLPLLLLNLLLLHLHRTTLSIHNREHPLQQIQAWELWLCRINKAIHTLRRCLPSSNRCTLLNRDYLLRQQPIRFRFSKVPRHHLLRHRFHAWATADTT